LIERLTSCISQEVRNYRKNFLIQEIKDIQQLPADSVEYKQKKDKNIGFVLVYNTILQFFARKLRNIQSSQVLLLFSFSLLFNTLILTVLVFALEYYALFKMDSTSFNGDVENNFFFFAFFSFCNFLTTTYGSFAPAGTLARIFVSLELLCTMLFGIILVFIFTTVVRDQHAERLNQLISDLENENDEIVGLLASQYDLSPSQARSIVQSTDPKSIQFIDLLLR
jgi:hypothetical protein